MDHMLIVHIPESLGPMERGEKYESPLSDILRHAGVGDVTGGGSLVDFSEEGLELCACDLELMVSDIKRAIALTKQFLLEVGAPDESTIEEVGENQLHRLF